MCRTSGYTVAVTCREFEDAMQSEITSVDPDQWKRRITPEDWTDLPDSRHLAHLTECSDCQSSLYQFLSLPDPIGYLEQPCFHVAYFSAEVPEKCLDLDRGL